MMLYLAGADGGVAAIENATKERPDLVYDTPMLSSFYYMNNAVKEV